MDASLDRGKQPKYHGKGAVLGMHAERLVWRTGKHDIPDSLKSVYFQVAGGVVEVKLKAEDVGYYFFIGAYIVGSRAIIEAHIAEESSASCLSLAGEGIWRDCR